MDEHFRMFLSLQSPHASTKTHHILTGYFDGNVYCERPLVLASASSVVTSPTCGRALRPVLSDSSTHVV